MTNINWTATKAEFEVISKIATRAHAMAKRVGGHYDYLEANMDLIACQCNGSPLKLAELYAADDFNFSHDVFGIRRHLNRKTAQLEDCFVPRYSADDRSDKFCFQVAA